PFGVDVDSDAFGAVGLGCRDDDAAVAAAEVVDCVASLDVGELEHAVDDWIGAGDKGNVEMRRSGLGGGEGPGKKDAGGNGKAHRNLQVDERIVLFRGGGEARRPGTCEAEPIPAAFCADGTFASSDRRRTKRSCGAPGDGALAWAAARESGSRPW